MYFFILFAFGSVTARSQMFELLFQQFFNAFSSSLYRGRHSILINVLESLTIIFAKQEEEETRGRQFTFLHWEVSSLDMSRGSQELAVKR